MDVHIYDINRIEVLEGPQGTLFGASSQAGTVRIITNKPDPTKFEASYELGVNQVDHGGTGYEVEGMVNLPISPTLALRLVGWKQHDAGYIDNVAGTNANAGIVDGVRSFPTWSTDGTTNGVPNNGGIGQGSISNAAYVKKDYNTVDTSGGRAALKLDIGDNWTVTPTVMGQRVTSEGFFGYDPAVGDLQVAHFGPEYSSDSWMQAALTVEGKVSNFDIVYAGAFMKRTPAIHCRLQRLLVFLRQDRWLRSELDRQPDGRHQWWFAHHAAGIGGRRTARSRSGAMSCACPRRKTCR